MTVSTCTACNTTCTCPLPAPAEAPAAAGERIAGLREASDALLPPLWLLLGALNIDNHDAQMDAYCDVLEPFERWREALIADSGLYWEDAIMQRQMTASAKQLADEITRLPARAEQAERERDEARAELKVLARALVLNLAAPDRAGTEVE